VRKRKKISLSLSPDVFEAANLLADRAHQSVEDWVAHLVLTSVKAAQAAQTALCQRMTLEAAFAGENAAFESPRNEWKIVGQTNNHPCNNLVQATPSWLRDSECEGMCRFKQKPCFWGALKSIKCPDFRPTFKLIAS
jgi:hypothetical protein